MSRAGIVTLGNHHLKGGAMHLLYASVVELVIHIVLKTQRLND
ncbi:hypothetical protein [Escherichia phage vB-Eco-KMB37]|nr:hypothetical protein [Escherichia phage vB-Eco-KMB37]